jgi:hypothetical protein
MQSDDITHAAKQAAAALRVVSRQGGDDEQRGHGVWSHVGCDRPRPRRGHLPLPHARGWPLLARPEPGHVNAGPYFACHLLAQRRPAAGTIIRDPAARGAPLPCVLVLAVMVYDDKRIRYTGPSPTRVYPYTTHCHVMIFLYRLVCQISTEWCLLVPDDWILISTGSIHNRYCARESKVGFPNSDARSTLL